MMQRAVEHGDADELARLLSNRDEDAAADGDWASLLIDLLIAACHYGHAECAQLLLAAKAAVDQADTDGTTPLSIACQQGHAECARLLLAANAAVDQAETDGTTPLFIACQQGRGECAQLLLAANAAVDQPGRDSDGGTPLAVACATGQSECTQLLLAAHATIDKPNSHVAPLLLTFLAFGPRCALDHRRHHNRERWHREGPRNEAEALRLVSDVTSAIEALEP